MRGLLTLAAVGFAIAAIAAPAQAAPITLNFDTTLGGAPIPAGTLVNVAYPPALTGATFSANAEVVFATGGAGGTPSVPNFAGDPPLFNSLIEVVFNGTTNFVQAQNVNFSAFTLTAFDINGNVLGSDTVLFAGPMFDVARIDAVGIARVRFTTVPGQPQQYGFDNFSFDVQQRQIPEPATVAVFGALAAGAFGLRRRVRKAA